MQVARSAKSTSSARTLGTRAFSPIKIRSGRRKRNSQSAADRRDGKISAAGSMFGLTGQAHIHSQQPCICKYSGRLNGIQLHGKSTGRGLYSLDQEEAQTVLQKQTQTCRQRRRYVQHRRVEGVNSRPVHGGHRGGR